MHLIVIYLEFLFFVLCLVQLVFDYDDLMKIPYFKSAIQEVTEEAEKLRYAPISHHIPSIICGCDQ